MNIPLYAGVEYPESDGKPMAETPVHMRVMWDTIQTLIAWFADPRVYVWGNMFLYYVPGDPRKSVSPDVMVIKGVSRDKPRGVFKVWEEGRGPCATIEVSSRKTRAEDLRTKYTLYQDVLKVREYFLFDAQADYLKPPLQGFRLWRGVYRPIAAEDGRLPSKELGLHLERHGEELRLWDPATRLWLPTPEETLRIAQEGRRQAEEDRQREAEARQREAEARQREAEARRAVEAENERLRRELAALRQKRRSNRK